MKFNLVRIDNRLLHGIVVSQWAGRTNAQRLMVIDDKTANDEFLKQSMMLARPQGMAVSIITYETALSNMKSGKYQGQSIFLLVKDPGTLLSLVENGIEIPAVQIGATEKLEGFKLSKRAYANDEELAAYKELRKRNVKITIQHVPTDDIVNFDSIIS